MASKQILQIIRIIFNENNGAESRAIANHSHKHGSVSDFLYKFNGLRHYASDDLHQTTSHMINPASRL